ncbi:sensor histidine kinase [Denitratisoma oestradiolicum]|uniref:Signal transduction histidine kinase internal region domain-containing protein n=1 Tax=Denitratisoma oestradiolicum TaxID=311182 RepID=A0A6S6Y4E1_9PROT|nr:histidine kinase [Denitratisoma oestradiolicum]TWO80409.1 hypothetical protein CBW56_09915 [Denitratisoma oestradiolicum]CAB1370220.1 protein of unknown function [Denitratisoma oestradiolicum]
MAQEDESIRQFNESPAASLLQRCLAVWRDGPARALGRGLLVVAAIEVALLVLALLVRWAGLSLGLLSVLLGGGLGAALALIWAARRPSEDALTEARLMALTARIRPHFLFNSLNAVLGTIRSDPRRAEAALEELAELFRAQMQDPRELVSLSEEIALCRQYLDLERLRLGARLQVQWDIANCPPDATMPRLILQPLLENAVYHGIEPMEAPGPIAIRLASAGPMVLIELSNPYLPGHVHAQGNRMALANIRERLQLFYGLAASLNAEVKGERYVLRIVLPHRRDGES